MIDNNKKALSIIKMMFYEGKPSLSAHKKQRLLNQK